MKAAKREAGKDGGRRGTHITLRTAAIYKWRRKEEEEQEEEKGKRRKEGRVEDDTKREVCLPAHMMVLVHVAFFFFNLVNN